MILPILALVILPVFQGDKQIPSEKQAVTLLHNCQAALRVFDSPTGGDGADTVPSQHCVDYMDGFVEGTVSAHGACFGKDSLGTIIRIYVTYMHDNPTAISESRIIGVRRAILRFYPCSQN